mmetsp:Transcript_10408/g.31354  ORF Transcript_10408/g.31354 Transcript_10408/m.31354 type:complete len:213 (-) Transcript_10408:281-919(-)
MRGAGEPCRKQVRQGGWQDAVLVVLAPALPVAVHQHCGHTAGPQPEGSRCQADDDEDGRGGEARDPAVRRRLRQQHATGELLGEEVAQHAHEEHVQRGRRRQHCGGVVHLGCGHPRRQLAQRHVRHREDDRGDDEEGQGVQPHVRHDAACQRPGDQAQDHRRLDHCCRQDADALDQLEDGLVLRSCPQQGARQAQARREPSSGNPVALDDHV